MPQLILGLLFVLLPVSALAWSGVVVAVHDGDTLKVRDPQGKLRKVRIYGVDCPELKQPFGKEARAMTERMVMGKTIEVIPAQKTSYKREVAGIVLLSDMAVLQNVLVSVGLAWVDDRYCKLAICDLWRMHQTDAQSAIPPRGLWADSEAISPWSWRKARKQEKKP